MKMLRLAKERGANVCCGVAEALPIKSNHFDYVLMVTTICFVDDLEKSFVEAKRLLKPNGSLIIGFVDKDSPLGREYLARKKDNVFYQEANFYSADELNIKLLHAGFIPVEIVQTVFGDLKSIKEVQKVHSGYGEGGFVVIRATLP